ncbi:UNVERIFIED_CONTAM: hypothetical protein HDU68_001654 [Siphonaria sp. JEL0065]|nr:hypothetical protein HDU68_001654 [Siphonaria sp. JEL0065]
MGVPIYSMGQDNSSRRRRRRKDTSSDESEGEGLRRMRESVDRVREQERERLEREGLSAASTRMATALRRARERNRAAISSSSLSLPSSGANLEVRGSALSNTEEGSSSTEGSLARLRRRLGLTPPTPGEQESFRDEFVRTLNLRRQREAESEDQTDDAEYWTARRAQLVARMNQTQNIASLLTRARDISRDISALDSSASVLRLSNDISAFSSLMARSNNRNNNQIPPPPPLPSAIANTSSSASTSSSTSGTAAPNLNLAFDGFDQAIRRARSLRQQRHFGTIAPPSTINLPARAESTPPVFGGSWSVDPGVTASLTASMSASSLSRDGGNDGNNRLTVDGLAAATTATANVRRTGSTSTTAPSAPIPSTSTSSIITSASTNRSPFIDPFSDALNRPLFSFSNVGGSEEDSVFGSGFEATSGIGNDDDYLFFGERRPNK